MTQSFTYRVDDCNGYFQVYKIVPEVRGPRGGLKFPGCEVKLGNVYPPGYKLFGEVQDEKLWTADNNGGDKFKTFKMEGAIGYLIAEGAV